MGDATPNPDPGPARAATEPEPPVAETPTITHAPRSGDDAAHETAAGHDEPTRRPGSSTVSGESADPAAGDLLGAIGPPRGPGELGWLGPYRVLGVLGTGGMGVVLRAEDPQLGRLVALKTMRPELAAVAANRQRFLREARAAAAIEHDHVIPIYHVGEDRSIPFLAMPLLKGETLDDRLRRDRRLPSSEVVRIGREVAEGLAAAHERGLVHRDIKPANIWLEEPRGRVRLLDFGLALSLEDTRPSLTQSGIILGTPAYMAPEQAAGRALDHRCDLFSLGCVLYRAATGARAFRGGDPIATLIAVATEHPRPPRDVEPSLPSALSDLVLALLQKEPDRRPPTARAVATALEAIGREPADAVEPVAPDRGPRPGGSWRAVASGLAPGPVMPPKPATRPRLPGAVKLLLGCAVASVLGLALLGAGIYLLATRALPGLVDGFEREMERQRGWDEAVRFWRPPPADAGPDRLFPDRVARFRLAGHDEDADIPDLEIEAEGHHATYRAGDQAVELCVYRATALEKEALYRRALEVLNPPKERDDGFPEPGDSKKARPNLRMVSGSAEGRSLTYRLDPPPQRGIFLWDRGWLFAARSHDGADPELFLKEYLATLSAGDRPARPEGSGRTAPGAPDEPPRPRAPGAHELPPPIAPGPPGG